MFLTVDLVLGRIKLNGDTRSICTEYILRKRRVDRRGIPWNLKATAALEGPSERVKPACEGPPRITC